MNTALPLDEIGARPPAGNETGTWGKTTFAGSSGILGSVIGVDLDKDGPLEVTVVSRDMEDDGAPLLLSVVCGMMTA